MALFSSKPQKANPAPRDRGVDTMIGADARFEGRIPVGHLPAGVHLLVIQQGDRVIRRRIVVF